MVYGAAVLAVLVSGGYLFGGGVDADTVCAVEFSRMAFGGGSAVGGSGQELALTKKGVEEAWNLSFER